MYAKLINQTIVPAPAVLVMENEQIINPTHDALLKAGYLPVQYVNPPEAPNGYYAVPSWVQTAEAIVQTWTVIEDTRPLTESELGRMLIATQINTLSMDTTMTLRCREFYPTWAEGSYQTGYTVRDGGNLWRCCQTHDSTGNPAWRPGLAPSLWGAYHATDAPLALPWVAPTGAHDAYQAGEYMVWTDGQVYRCLVDGTVWGPDTVPGSWEVVTT